MNFYPVNLKLKAKKVLIVGGGKVGLRKFKRLLKARAEITVVSPKFNSGFKSYPDSSSGSSSDQFQLLKRRFREDDLIGKVLVIAATDNRELNERIALLARGRNILVNIIDNPELSDFTVPAAVNKGELLLTVSTGSNLPALSKKIRKKLQQEFGPEYSFLLQVMKEKREEILNSISSIQLRRKIFKSLAADKFLSRIGEIIAQSELNYSAEKEVDFESSEAQMIMAEIEKEIAALIEQEKKTFTN